MNKVKTILIKKDIISLSGAIIIPKGKLLKLDMATISKLKLHGVLHEVLSLINSNNTSFDKKLIEVLSNNNNQSIQLLKNNNPKKYMIILDIMDNFLFESRNEEWYLYLSTLFNGYSWYYSHSIDVAVISAMIGLTLGYKNDQIHALILGSLLHDIGIILLPQNILFKDKNLFTPEEKDIFEKHSSLGYEMTKNLSIPKTCKNIILDHHKLLNGGGYPKSEDDYELSIESKIVIVSDYFDSETTAKQSPEQIIDYMINNPNHFPIEIVAILKNIIKL